MQYNATYDKWFFIGKLMNGRYDHSAIVINKKIFIIGGQSDFPAEECGLTVPSFCSSVNKIEVTVKKPKLFGFSLSDCNIYTEIQIIIMLHTKKFYFVAAIDIWSITGQYDH